MKAIQHLNCNGVLGPPKGVPIEECSALAVRRGQYTDGTMSTTSYWKPSPEELIILNTGGCVTVEILSFTHSPLLIGAVE